MSKVPPGAVRELNLERGGDESGVEGHEGGIIMRPYPPVHNYQLVDSMRAVAVPPVGGGQAPQPSHGGRGVAGKARFVHTSSLHITIPIGACMWWL